MAHLTPLTSLAEETKRKGFTHALVLGIGGSSLCPEVMKMTFGKKAGFSRTLRAGFDRSGSDQSRPREGEPRDYPLHCPEQVGGRLEPNIFKQYFFNRVRRLVGPKEAAQRFIAITDRGSALQQVAEVDGFRHLYFGLSSIGGRYSALSNFDMVLAAVMGVDVAQILERAEEMVEGCSSYVPVEENPGLVLGTILGVLANHGRDKVAIVASPGLSALGAWLEQLLAESTGKAGKGIIPVDREVVGTPDVYGADRVFVYVRLQSEPEPSQDAAVEGLVCAAAFS